MCMVPKLIMVVTYCDELSPISLHDPSVRWSCELTWQITYFHLQKTHGHQPKQSTELSWEASSIKATWYYVRSCDKLENLYLQIQKFYGH